MNLKKWFRRVFVVIAVMVVLGIAYRTVAAQSNLWRASRLEVSEETYPAYTDQGYERMRLGDFKGAIADFDQAEELHPSQCINIYTGRAYAYYKAGDFDKALVEFDQALFLDANSATVYFYRGLVYLHKGDYEAAIADYDKAIALGGEADSYFNRGTALLLSGQVGHGTMDYLQGIRLKGSPTNAANEP